MDAPPDPILEDLTRDPWSFDFYRAVRRLECLYRDRPRVGYSARLGEDPPVRFGMDPSMAFAPATLAGFVPENPGDGLGPDGGWRPARMLIQFFGLLGANGPMPLHLTEFAHERKHNARDATLTRFLDIFHHRAASLFYRAWADVQKSVDYDRPEDARFADYLGSFFGLGMRVLRNRDATSDDTKVFFSGRLAMQTRPPEGLEAIVGEDLEVPTRLETFVGQWIKLPEPSQLRLGASPGSGTLGQTAIVGTRFWTRQLKFRLCLGPLHLTEYERLLPGGSAWKRLRDWVRLYVGQEFFWDAQLILLAAEVPAIALGRAGQLGRTAWLKSRAFPRDADDLVLAGED